ncbi:MAG: RDD family protein [Angustibacter sp.]
MTSSRPDAQPGVPSAGWYPDPHVPGQMRWWDGAVWTADTYERTDAAPPGQGSHLPAAQRHHGDPSSLSGHAPEQIDDGRAARVPFAAAPAGVVPSTDDGVPLAGWGRRAVARALDAAVVLVVTLLVGARQGRIVSDVLGDQFAAAVVAAERGDTSAVWVTDERLQRAIMVLVGIWLLLVLAYDLIFLLWRQATPGKLLLGLRIRTWEPGRPVTGGMVVRRWLAFQVVAQLSYVGVVYAVVDAVWPLRDSRRRTLHDRFARTVVVRIARPVPPAGS